jgi:dTDP-glucose pyrophosphorylase
MTDPLTTHLVPRDATIRDALAALDRGAGGILLAVEADGRLVGVASDGDLRRALLVGKGLDDPLDPVLTTAFVAIGPEQGRVDALDLMRAHRIDAIPVVDADGRPVALHLLHAFLQPAIRDNWAVIMAGGQGRRLRPLTEQVPKPMLRVAGRPILERIVLHLVGFGITRIFLSVLYRSEVIEAHFGDGSRFGASIEYLRETRPLGTAGALGLLEETPSVPLLMLNGDLVTSVDVDRLLAFHTAGRYHATIGTHRYVHTIPYGCVERDGDRVVALEEKPAISREVNTGIYVLEPAVVARVERDVPQSMPDIIERLLLDGGTVGAFEVEDDWTDIGQRDQLIRARGEEDA